MSDYKLSAAAQRILRGLAQHWDRSIELQEGCPELERSKLIKRGSDGRYRATRVGVLEAAMRLKEER